MSFILSLIHIFSLLLFYFPINFNYHKSSSSSKPKPLEKALPSLFPQIVALFPFFWRQKHRDFGDERTHARTHSELSNNERGSAQAPRNSATTEDSEPTGKARRKRLASHHRDSDPAQLRGTHYLARRKRLASHTATNTTANVRDNASGYSLHYGTKTMCGRIGVSFSRSKSDAHTVKFS